VCDISLEVVEPASGMGGWGQEIVAHNVYCMTAEGYTLFFAWVYIIVGAVATLAALLLARPALPRIAKSHPPA